MNHFKHFNMNDIESFNIITDVRPPSHKKYNVQFEWPNREIVMNFEWNWCGTCISNKACDICDRQQIRRYYTSNGIDFDICETCVFNNNIEEEQTILLSTIIK